MSFFKKLLGTTDLPAEQKAKVLSEREAKLRAKKERQEKEDRLFERYFGNTKKTNGPAYKQVISYFEKNIKSGYEQVLAAIPAEFDKAKHREIKGLLIAASDRLLFVTFGIGHGQFVETFEYHKINGISLDPDGFSKKELLIDYGRSRRIFDDIANNDHFEYFLNIAINKIHEAKKKPISRKEIIKTTTKPQPTDNKYERLEQIAKLRGQGILTEEEFQLEKSKILNT